MLAVIEQSGNHSFINVASASGTTGTELGTKLKILPIQDNLHNIKQSYTE